MHHVDQLFKQDEVVRIRSYACPDKNAVEQLLIESALNNCRRSFAKVGETHVHAVPETGQFVFRGLEAC